MIFCERIIQESCLGYIEGDEFKALSGGKYRGYPIRGQTKSYEYSYMHYIFLSLWRVVVLNVRLSF
ncbi:hypothetical protein MtrunA17_Chr6g0450311 [Medicago truncatula]|uniref:Uncharacterized protein n=1 Tax=Medicago truncatula TaxID=3880 RepID=A0A396HER2_MEDTR|nr:hypothetical protein MtrunA17_Chr6g0450311 [Medicago truncatula]